MGKQGRPIRLVNQFAEDWPISKWNMLPTGLRGVYVLLNKSHVPLYVGRSGKGEADIRIRIYNHRRSLYYGKKVKFFSAYGIDRGYIRQMETFLLRAVGDLLKWNTNKGRFLKGAVELTYD